MMLSAGRSIRFRSRAIPASSRLDRSTNQAENPRKGLWSGEGRADLGGMKQAFPTSVGIVEVLVDEPTRIVSVYRFDSEHRPIAAAIESWDHTDLVDVLTRQAGVPVAEAQHIASVVQNLHPG